MTKRFLNKYLLVTVLSVGLALPAYAAEGGKTCTKNDLREIKAFNSLAKAKVKDHEELIADTSNVKSERDAKEFTEDFERIKEFFRSEEFAAMEKKYEQCDMTIPRPMAKQSFWIPEDQRIYYSGI